MRLEVLERLALLSVLPKEGDFLTLKLVRKLRESLAFSEVEIESIKFNLRWKCPRCQKELASPEAMECPDCDIYMTNIGQMTWDIEKAKSVVKDIHLGNKMLALCTLTLRKLSDEQKLTEQHMSLYEKFVEADENEGGQ